jgi:hypothetical protein
MHAHDALMAHITKDVDFQRVGRQGARPLALIRYCNQQYGDKPVHKAACSQSPSSLCSSSCPIHSNVGSGEFDVPREPGGREFLDLRDMNKRASGFRPERPQCCEMPRMDRRVVRWQRPRHESQSLKRRQENQTRP